MRHLTTELGQAARTLARMPGFSLIAVLTLALGIGANTAIFAVVHGVVLSPLDMHEADRVVQVSHHAPGLGLDELGQSDPTALLYMEQVSSFAAFAVVDGEGRNLSGDDGRPAERARIMSASWPIFDVVAAAPRLGRALTPEDSEPGAPPVAILSHALWRDRYGSDPTVVGRVLRLDGEPVEIVGVVGPDFGLPDEEFDLVVPATLDPDEGFGSFGTTGLARLAPGATLERARAEVEALQPRFPEFFDIDTELLDAAEWRVSVVPIRERVIEEVEATVWILMGTVGLLLLIAAANVANLVLVRAEARQREVAVRSALGATRVDLARTWLAESTVLGAAGGLLGLILGWGALRLVLQVAPAGLPRRGDIAVDPVVLAFGAGLTLLVALGFGLLPLFARQKGDLAGALRDGLRGSTAGPGALRGRNVLVSVQLALALLLLAGSGLMLRSFVALRAVDPGVDVDDVTVVEVDLDRRYAEPGQVTAFHRQLTERVAALPGVEAVGLADRAPLEGGGISAGSFEVENGAAFNDGIPVVALRVRITPGYLEALGIPLLDGRPPAWSDSHDAGDVVWVNRTLAERYIDGDPVGRRIRNGDASAWMTVAGVVGDVRHSGVNDEVRPTIYRTVEAAGLDEPTLSASLMVRGPGSLRAAPAVRDVLTGLDRNVPLARIRTLDEIAADDVASTSFTLTLLAIAAAMSLLLGTVGIYGVISYVVGRRTRELGVRMALGAGAAEVRAMVLQQGVGVIVLGLALGLAAALGATRLMASLLYEVSPTDPWVLGSTTLLLFVVGVAATLVPAVRASRVDPVEALRSE